VDTETGETGQSGGAPYHVSANTGSVYIIATSQTPLRPGILTTRLVARIFQMGWRDDFAPDLQSGPPLIELEGLHGERCKHP